MFYWKDRAGAVRQAVWEYEQSIKKSQKLIDEMTPEDIVYHKKMWEITDPNWKMSIDTEGTFEGTIGLVLGCFDRYVNYFCVDPENMPGKTHTRFVNDVRKAIRRREEDRKTIAFLEEFQNGRTP